jgi:hypothetical protein
MMFQDERMRLMARESSQVMSGMSKEDFLKVCSRFCVCCSAYDHPKPSCCKQCKGLYISTGHEDE